YSLRKKGVDGIKKDVQQCIDTACYLRDKLGEAGFTCRLNDLSCTVVLERPMCDDFIKRWQLACERDIAHVVVMPNVTREKIDVFIEEFKEVRGDMGRMPPQDDKSPLSQLSSSSWGGGTYVAPMDLKAE
ncbi:hypothetical protein TeGR_g6657, partial [Tetraparma gracilis]